MNFLRRLFDAIRHHHQYEVVGDVIKCKTCQKVYPIPESPEHGDQILAMLISTLSGKQFLCVDINENGVPTWVRVD